MPNTNKTKLRLASGKPNTNPMKTSRAFTPQLRCHHEFCPTGHGLWTVATRDGETHYRLMQCITCTAAEVDCKCRPRTRPANRRVRHEALRHRMITRCCDKTHQWRTATQVRGPPGTGQTRTQKRSTATMSMNATQSQFIAIACSNKLNKIYLPLIQSIN